MQKRDANSVSSADSTNSCHQTTSVNNSTFVRKKGANFVNTKKRGANLPSCQAAPVKDSATPCIKDCEFGEFANLSREAASVKDSQIRNSCEFDANFSSKNLYFHITEKVQISQALISLNGGSSIALDTETTSNDKLRLIQLCDGSNAPIILDIPVGDIKSELVKFLRYRELIIQNSKFDLRVLKNALGVEISITRVFDTYIGSVDQYQGHRRTEKAPSSELAPQQLGIDCPANPRNNLG